MRVKRRRDSSLSDDDKPLIMMAVRQEDHNSFDSLCRHSRQMCELCDRVFDNRYHKIIHNMKHIIIPLLNLTVYECKECLHHFTSQTDLYNHTRNKHPKTKIPEVALVKKEKIIIKKEPHPRIMDLKLPKTNLKDRFKSGIVGTKKAV